MDETSVSFAPELRSGLIVKRSSHQAKSLVAKQDTRTNLTYVATICDDESLQERMPQFIIGDNARIRDKDMASLREPPKNNVHIWRNEKSAWNNHTLMQKMLQVLSDSLSHRPDLQPVLILDVASCHIHRNVFQKARALGIWLVLCQRNLLASCSPWTPMPSSVSSRGFAGSMLNCVANLRMGWCVGWVGSKSCRVLRRVFRQKVMDKKLLRHRRPAAYCECDEITEHLCYPERCEERSSCRANC
jgi:hypothetical protein